MTGSEASLRERALAAWHERHQEMRVEKERRNAADALVTLRLGLRRVVGILHDTDPASRSDKEVKALADAAGIEATDPIAGPAGWQVDFLIDHIRLRYTRDAEHRMELDAEHRMELVAECPDCGGETVFGYRIASLTALGIALDEQMKNPKGMHRCSPADDLNDDPLPEVATVSRDDDPAHVLLDALQGYIHAAVRGEVVGTWLEAKRDAESRGEPF